MALPHFGKSELDCIWKVECRNFNPVDIFQRRLYIVINIPNMNKLILHNIW